LQQPNTAINSTFGSATDSTDTTLLGFISELTIPDELVLYQSAWFNLMMTIDTSLNGDAAIGGFDSALSARSPSTNSLPRRRSAQVPMDTWICSLLISVVSRGTHRTADLFTEAKQFCSGDGWAPEDVCASMWRWRWWGGQLVTGNACSGWSYAGSSDATAGYHCKNDYQRFSYYGVATGKADYGTYEAIESGYEDPQTYRCG
jgi:hypothetical protein